MNRVLYFAYGSNLHPLRLRLRAASARKLGCAGLRGYRLTFRKHGRDGTAKCDAQFTGRREDLVQGVVYGIARKDWRALDQAEDLGRGYDRVRLWVSVGARRRAVFAYLARPESIAQELRPFDWYLDYVVRGARHHGLAGRYVQVLARESALRDPAGARRRSHLGVSWRGARPFRRR